MRKTACPSTRPQCGLAQDKISLRRKWRRANARPGPALWISFKSFRRAPLLEGHVDHQFPWLEFVGVNRFSGVVAGETLPEVVCGSDVSSFRVGHASQHVNVLHGVGSDYPLVSVTGPAFATRVLARNRGTAKSCGAILAYRPRATAGICHSALARDGRWRRGELNPRPRNLATRRLHACPVPMVSPRELRAGKTRPRLVR